MQLSAGVMFLSWTALFGLIAVADSSPGILVRLSGNGLQYGAEWAVKWLDRRTDQGMRVPDKDGSLSSYLGSVDYFLTEIEVKEFSSDNPTVVINQGVGVTFDADKIQASIVGKFSYKYTLMYIPTWNSGTFKLTISNVSLSVQATAGMSPDGHPTVDFLTCSASVGNVDLKYRANTANWFLNLFAKIVKNKIESTLTNAICKAIKNGRNSIAKEVAKYMKPCLDSRCDFLTDLRLVSPPVFGENFIETAHRGEIFWKNDTSLAPFEAPPFQRLPTSRKMIELYVNAYVLNTLMFAMYQNHLLSYNFTKNDLPDEYRNVLDTSCDEKSLCVGRVFPKIFAPYPNASVELDFVAISAPFLNITNTSFSIVFNVCANVQLRKSDESILALSVVTLEGSVVGSAFTNQDGLIEFTVTDIMFVNASISDKELESDFFRSNNATILSRLQIAAKKYLLPKINEFGQRGLSVPTVGGFYFVNRSLKLIQNAFLFTANAGTA